MRQRLSAETQGSGAAGTVVVEAPQISLKGGALISAQSTGIGDAGTIRIMTDILLLNGNSTVGNADLIVVVPLPQPLLPVAALLPNRCAARLREGTIGSFVQRGLDGLATIPDHLLPSPLWTCSHESGHIWEAQPPHPSCHEAALKTGRQVVQKRLTLSPHNA